MASSNDGARDGGKPLAGDVSKENAVDLGRNMARRGTAVAVDPIASALRRLHDDVVSEPIPDDFMSLLASIDKKREGRSS